MADAGTEKQSLQAGGRYPNRLSSSLGSVSDSAAFAYGTLLLLQFARMRGIFEAHALTGGDTSSYFVKACAWHSTGHGDFAWSPLYTGFLGVMLNLSPDAAFAVTLHRALIACSVTVLVLAVMRKMLPKPLAWAVAAWWAVLPNNFDARYEVHLFAMLPVLCAWLAILSWRGVLGRCAAVGILTLAALLVRNEMFFAVGCLLSACLVRESSEFRRSPRSKTRLQLRLLSYLLPLAGAVLVSSWFFHRSNVTGSALVSDFSAKHRVNMAQVYAFGYAQRHPEWKPDPWTEYQGLCVQQFGVAEPTLWQMVSHNPGAWMMHVVWNYSLLPNGVQNMLFNATSGSRDPDYGAALRRGYVVPLTLGVAAVIAIGTYRYGVGAWRAALRGERGDGWMAMACVVAVCILVVVPTQRPRSAYMFPMTLFLMCLTATMVNVVIPRLSEMTWLMPLPMTLLPLVVPGIYTSTSHRHQRLVYTEYVTLEPYSKFLTTPDAVLLGRLPLEMYHYTGKDHPLLRWCGYDSLNQMGKGKTLEEFLHSSHITVVELDVAERDHIQHQFPGVLEDFLSNYARHGWTRCGSGSASTWLFFRIEPAETSINSR